MGPFEMLLAVLGPLREWMESLSKYEAAQNANVRSALKSISVAAMETKAYLADLRDARLTQDREKELALSRLWQEAGVDLARVDRQLSERCFQKSDYWSDPHGWEVADRDDSKIKLDELYQAARAVLIGSGSNKPVAA